MPTLSEQSFLADILADRLPHVAFVFPHAPIQPVSVNMGMSMVTRVGRGARLIRAQNSWYDISPPSSSRQI